MVQSDLQILSTIDYYMEGELQIVSTQTFAGVRVLLSANALKSTRKDGV
jgi:hypothetical protein